MVPYVLLFILSGSMLCYSKFTLCQASQPVARGTVAWPWGLMGKGACARVDLRTSLHAVLLYHASKHVTACCYQRDLWSLVRCQW